MWDSPWTYLAVGGTLLFWLILTGLLSLWLMPFFDTVALWYLRRRVAMTFRVRTRLEELLVERIVKIDNHGVSEKDVKTKRMGPKDTTKPTEPKDFEDFEPTEIAPSEALTRAKGSRPEDTTKFGPVVPLEAQKLTPTDRHLPGSGTHHIAAKKPK